MNDAASLREFEMWLEAWAMFTGHLPDDGRYRMVQEDGMWVAHRVGTAPEGSQVVHGANKSRTAVSATLVGYRTRPASTSTTAEPKETDSKPANSDATETAGPGPETSAAFQDKVRLALQILDPKVARWWKAPSVSGLVRSRDATSWPAAWRFNACSEMQGDRPIITVDMHFTAGETAQAIMREVETGWFADSIGAYYRKYKFATTPGFEEFRKWQQGATSEAARLTSVMAELYYNSIANLTSGGDLVLTVGDLAENGPRWDQLLSVLPLLGHLPIGAIILKLGKRTIKLPKALVRKLEALRPKERKALVEYAQSFAKSEDDAAAIIQRGVQRHETTTFRGGYHATLGVSTSRDYRATFLRAHPELNNRAIVVHHAIEQRALTRYPGVISESEMHSLDNLRGIPAGVDSELHLSQIRLEWNAFYNSHPTAEKVEILDKATEIDLKFGTYFLPPVGQ